MLLRQRFVASARCRFCDASASGSLASGVFAGHSAAITHQLPSTAKAGYLAQLGRNGHSRNIRDTAQCLQIVDDLLLRR
jgi:hypothetical protein